MRQQRHTNEIIIDEALTLSLLAEVELRRPSPAVDRLRLQKLTFQLAHKWFSSQWKGFNYTFFRYTHGPFTKDLYQTEFDLASAGLIEGGSGWTFSLSDDGRELANELIEHVWTCGENALFWHDIQEIAAKTADLSTRQLIRQVYAQEVVPLGWSEPMTVEDLPLGVDLTRIFDDVEVVEALDVPDEWIETIGIMRVRGENVLDAVSSGD